VAGVAFRVEGLLITACGDIVICVAFRVEGCVAFRVE